MWPHFFVGTTCVTSSWWKCDRFVIRSRLLAYPIPFLQKGFFFLPAKVNVRWNSLPVSEVTTVINQELFHAVPRSGELRAQKLKPYLVRTQSLNVLPLKPGVSRYIAIHATLTAGIYSLPVPALLVHSSAFFQNFSQFFLRWLWLTHCSCVGLQNEIGYPAWGRFPCWVPVEYE